MLTSVAYLPGCTGVHSQPQSDCSPQTKFTEYTTMHAGTVISTVLLATTLPSATTSRVPLNTCACAVQGTVPVKVTLKFSVWFWSPGRGPKPAAGVMDVTKAVMPADGTSLTLLIEPTAA